VIKNLFNAACIVAYGMSMVSIYMVGSIAHHILHPEELL
jgi:hypothetical protein